MKRVIIPLVFSLLIAILFPLASFAGADRTLTILYTGSVKGVITPCPT